MALLDLRSELPYLAIKLGFGEIQRCERVRRAHLAVDAVAVARESNLAHLAVGDPGIAGFIKVDYGCVKIAQELAQAADLVVHSFFQLRCKVHMTAADGDFQVRYLL